MSRTFAIGNPKAFTTVESDEESELDAAQEAADTFMLQPGERMFQLSPDADFEPIAEYRRGLTLEVVKVSPKEA